MTVMASPRLFLGLTIAAALFVAGCSGNNPEDSAAQPTTTIETAIDTSERELSTPGTEIESGAPSAIEAAPETTTEPPAPQPDIPGVLFVSPSGVDTPGGGRFPDQPLLTPAFAVGQSVPGDIIEMASGTYGPLEIVGRQELELRPEADADVRITSNSYIEGAGLQIIDSDSIKVSGLTFERLLWGIQVQGSQAIILSENRLSDIGQEAISVSLESSDVQILGNQIELTGRREGNDGRFDYRTFGEGIYLGTGSTSADGSVDVVNNVLIDGNTISHTTAEAIDVKASVVDVRIINNVIHDIDVASGGAIAIGRGTRDYNANVTVENNAIYNVTTWSPYTDGIGIRVSSTANIRNNAIWGVAHRGILVDEEFRSTDGTGVEIADNLIFDTGLDRIENRPGDVVSICGTRESPDGLGFDPNAVTVDSVRALLASLAESASC